MPNPKLSRIVLDVRLLEALFWASLLLKEREITKLQYVI
jgi:hypothetical protein